MSGKEESIVAGGRQGAAVLGLVGLGVMGENLILNMANHGFTVSVYNRTVDKVDKFASGRGNLPNIIPCRSPEEFVASLAKPRKIFLLVQAGNAVDMTIDKLLPLLEQGDIVIDGGNSHFPDTQRRFNTLREKQIHFVGCGVSGGEEGALNGPSIMPGGAAEAWPAIKEILQSISAKASDGKPCCDWIGPGGSGHFVKMVHNGIEYGDMQLIAEGYFILKHLLDLTNQEMHQVFRTWNTGVLDSYLIEITADILVKLDDGEDGAHDGGFIVDRILDKAGQKGTGKWTAVAALDAGMPLTLIGEAVFARCLSAQKAERVRAAQKIHGAAPAPVVFGEGEKAALIDAVRDALYAAKIVSYAQGFVLLRAAAQELGWKSLNYAAIAGMWRGGCIIRSKFLNNITEAFERDPELENLLLDDFFVEQVHHALPGWRRIASQAILNGIAIPAISSALSYFDGYRTADGPANLIQAQRDYFGAHTYERKDKPEGTFFHCNWTGHGGNTTAGTYNA